MSSDKESGRRGELHFSRRLRARLGLDRGIGIDDFKQVLTQLATGFRKPLIIAFTAFVVSYVDPLGIEEATGERARSTIMRLSAALFSSSQDVTVVLINQQFVDSLPGKSWPLSYSEQGLLLRRIDAYAPAAVFVDLLYKNPHRTFPVTATTTIATSKQDAPGDLVRTIRAPNAPFYFAALPKHGGARGRADVVDLESFAPALEQDAEFRAQLQSRLAIVSWNGYGNSYPLQLTGHEALRSPAYALYADYCASEKTDDKKAKRCRGSSGEFTKPLMVRWGAFIPTVAAQHTQNDVCQYTPDRAQLLSFIPLRFRALTRQFFLALVDRTNEATSNESRLPCIAVNVLRASLLTNASDSRNEDLIRDSIAHHFVFVGAEIPGIPDFVTSPVHGQTAGVMLHAMAMQNLLVDGDDYLRATPEWALTLLKLVTLCAVAVFFAARPRKESGGAYWLLVALGIAMWVACAAFAFAHDNTLRGMLFLIGGVLVTWLAAPETGKVVLLFLIVCASALLMIELGWEPTNWIVLAVAAGIVQQLVERLRRDARDEAATQDKH